MTDMDPIEQQFRDYKPDPALQHRDRGLLALEIQNSGAATKGRRYPLDLNKTRHA